MVKSETRDVTSEENVRSENGPRSDVRRERLAESCVN